MKKEPVFLVIFLSIDYLGSFMLICCNQHIFDELEHTDEVYYCLLKHGLGIYFLTALWFLDLLIVRLLPERRLVADNWIQQTTGGMNSHFLLKEVHQKQGRNIS